MLRSSFYIFSVSIYNLITKTEKGLLTSDSELAVQIVMVALIIQVNTIIWFNKNNTTFLCIIFCIA